MRRYKLQVSKRAVRDIEEVLAYTVSQFGEGKYGEYKDLIGEAMTDLLHDPFRAPAKYRPEIHRDAMTFHIGRRGRKARHLFLYRVREEKFVDIARLLHDSMDVERNLPEEF